MANANVAKKEESLQYLRLPLDTLIQYHKDKTDCVMASKKKKKALLRNISNIEGTHKGLEGDYKKYLEYLAN